MQLNLNTVHTLNATNSTNNLLDGFEMQSTSERTTSQLRRRMSETNDETACSSMIGTIMMLTMVFLLLCTFPLSLYFCFLIIHDHEKAVLFRNGRLHSAGSLGPGLVFVLPMIDRYFIIDCRIVCFDIPPQKVLTKDSITIDVDAVVLYRVNNAIVAITNVENYSKATEFLAAIHLRNILGTKTLAQILSDSLSINENLQVTLDSATDFWGVRVVRIDIKNVKLPKSLQSSMSAEAMAVREAKAKYIQADGEQKASQKLAEAANVIDSQGTALQLRYLQTLGNISMKNNQTIVVPFPIELFDYIKEE